MTNTEKQTPETILLDSILLEPAVRTVKQLHQTLAQQAGSDLSLPPHDIYDDLEEDESIYSRIKPADILEAMNQLSPAYRMVFNLYAIENHTHQEVSEILNINIGTSKSNYSKAKAKLKKILEQKFNL